MKVSYKFVLTVFVAACAGPAFAQTPISSKGVDESCLIIQVEIDEVSLNEPVTLLIGRGDETLNVPWSGSCFQLPKSWLDKKEVAVRMDVGKNSLFFGTISTDNFDCPWDIWLSDKKGTIKAGKHRYKNTTVCRLEFRKGEPGVGIQVAPCRTSRKPPPATTS